MAEYPINPEDIIVDFLRVHLTDPRARAEATDTNNLVATAGQTEFDVTPSAGNVSCVTDVQVNSVSVNKWSDYFWDYQNSKITFYTGLSLNDTVDITFKYGTSNWIYADKPDEDSSETYWPMISVFAMDAPGDRLGQYSAPVEGRVIMQIDVWSRFDQIFTIGGRKYSNNYLGRYIGYRVTRAFEKNESDLFPVLYNYNPVSGPKSAPVSEEYSCNHTIVQAAFKGLNIGRIEV